MNKKIDMYTPEELAKYLLTFINYEKGDRFYEPFRGNGAFYNNMPEPKDWSEITQGRDFFIYRPFNNGKCEHIVTNPPFTIDINGIEENGFILTLEYSMDIATKTIAYLVNHKFLNSLTPQRLNKYYKNGWSITNIMVLSISKWYGRYWYLIFSKDSKSLIKWNIRNW